MLRLLGLLIFAAFLKAAVEEPKFVCGQTKNGQLPNDFVAGKGPTAGIKPKCRITGRESHESRPNKLWVPHAIQSADLIWAAQIAILFYMLALLAFGLEWLVRR